MFAFFGFQDTVRGYTDMFFLVENGGIPLPWPRHSSCELGGQPLVHHNAT